MKILLIDTTIYSPEYAYYEDNQLVFTKKITETRNADTVLTGLKDELKLANRELCDVEVVSLSNGPGSFTGLRVGLSIAKGICTGSGCKLVILNTLDIIANKFFSKVSGVSVTPLIPANTRNQEYYFADYISGVSGAERVGEYGSAVLKDIKAENFVTNESIKLGTEIKCFDVSDEGNMYSQYKMTVKCIEKENYADFRTTEPFYLKNFTPIKKL